MAHTFSQQALQPALTADPRLRACYLLFEELNFQESKGIASWFRLSHPSLQDSVPSISDWEKNSCFPHLTAWMDRSHPCPCQVRQALELSLYRPQTF